MKIRSIEAKDDLHKRLRRIEGQTRGLQKMLEEDRDCREVLQQLKAVRSAVDNATGIFMHKVARQCLLEPDHNDERDPEEVVDELLELLAKVK